MQRDVFQQTRNALFTLVTFLCCLPAATAQPPAALNAFQRYAAEFESRQTATPQQLVERTGIRPAQGDDTQLRIDRLTGVGGVAVEGGLIHHWRGTAFVPGAKARDLQSSLRDFDSFPRHYAPAVLSTHTSPAGADRRVVQMRIRQKHILTVVLDLTSDVSFSPLTTRQAGWSTSRSTRVVELMESGANQFVPGPDHGYLWALNSYWRWQQVEGGLYVQFDSLSLSRDVPRGLGWAVRPYLESVPSESLEFTLRRTLEQLPRQEPGKRSEGRTTR